MKNYQVMPELTHEEYEELKRDISERGVLVPVEVDEEGAILDGYHRVQICKELGIKDYPIIVRQGMTEEEKLTHARKLNMLRRHLTREQKHDLIREQIKETPEKSDRQIASNLGVSHPTVGTIRHEMEETGDVEKFTTSTDTLGREQPRSHYTIPANSNQSQDATVSMTNTGAVNAYNEPLNTMSDYEYLQKTLHNEAIRLDQLLLTLLDDYDRDNELKDMLFSPDGISVALNGLSELAHIVEKYNDIVSGREKDIDQRDDPYN